MSVSIEERSVEQLLADTGDGAEPLKCRALAENPYLKSRQELGQVVGLCEGTVAGSEYVFPLLIHTPRGEVPVLAGSTLNVEQKYRRSGLGMDLPELRWQKSPSKIAVGAGLSQMAVPVHQLLDYSVFFLPRHLILWKSRSVVEMRFSGIVARLVTACLDALIRCYALVLAGIAKMRVGSTVTSEISPDDAESLAEVVKVISRERRLFSEVHDQAWLKWHLTSSFSKDGPAKLFLVRRQGRPIAFYMTKRRFHKQASHRGFKNVWLGSILEWGAEEGFEHLLPWVLLLAALSMREDCVDAVEIPTDDPKISKVLKLFGWRVVGDGNFVIKAGEGAVLKDNPDMKCQNNWRLRPAMGDNGLS